MKHLSVIIPAYNEAERLPRYLSQLLPTLRELFGHRFEVIVVDDGSADDTIAIAQRLLGREGSVVSLSKNLGKGAAVRAGVNQAEGQVIAITDADGAASVENFRLALDMMAKSSPAGVIGRRYQADSASEKTDIVISWKRKLLGRVFAAILRTFLNLDYADTQCGFKVFNGTLAKILFRDCRLDRFGIDFELLYLASLHGIRFQELPIKWREIPGSKVNIFRDGIRMLRDIFTVRNLHRHDLQLGKDFQEAQVSASTTTVLNGFKKSNQNDSFNDNDQTKEKRVGSP